MKVKNKKSLYFVFVIVLTLFIGIGYASVTSIDLTVTGEAALDRQDGVIISDIAYKAGTNVNSSASKINSYYKSRIIC